jgi:hypothetical protein
MYDVNKKTIWNFRQNNPELVINDAREFLRLSEDQCDILRNILLARGVNKWLKVRRDLIAYKKQIKHRICEIQQIIPRLKSYGYGTHLIELKQELKTLQKIRGDLKRLCMTDRWQIWPQGKSHHTTIKLMNTLTASGD